jgi:hypothetical protein
MNVATDNWLKSRNLPRLAFATALSPPVAGAVLALILGLTVFQSQVFFIEDPQQDSVYVRASILEVFANMFTILTSGFLIGGLIGWPVMLAIGLPSHALLLRRTSAKVWWYVLAGCIAGVIAGALRFVSSRGATTMNDALQLAAIGAVTGTLAALVFWFVRRPDTDAAEYKS